MSGIVALVHIDGAPVRPDQLAGMTGALAHRGPDGTGHWTHGPVGLGQCMFHTTPESLHETQPLLDASGRLCLVVDGRVDNRRELRAAIVRAGGAVRDDTDAELILQAYACWGEVCVERMIGEWAFVLWDDVRQRLVFARDPAGIRQLLYYLQDGLLLIATEPAGIFGFPGLEREVNWRVLGQYVNDTWTEHVQTLDAGVLRLPGGHVAVFVDGALSMRRYWPGDLSREIRYKREEEYAEHYRELFAEVVADQLRSPTTVGIYLSGGLDSSSIACMADDLVRRRGDDFPTVETLSMVYPGLECDESDYLDAVTDVLHLPSHRLANGIDSDRIAPLELAADWPDILYNPAMMVDNFVCVEWVRPRGMRVLLDGIGGDENFSAMPWWTLADTLRSGDAFDLYRKLQYAQDYTGKSMLRLFLESAVGPLLPEAMKHVVKRARPQPKVSAPYRLGDWIDPDFATRWQIEEHLIAPSRPVPPLKSISKQHLYRLFTASYNMIFALEWNDWALTRFGIELRHPFLDRRLLDYCLLIPEEARAGGEIGKHLLREAMRDLLPVAIYERKGKVIFNTLQDQLFNKRQRQAVDAIFADLRLEREGVLTKGAGQRLLADYRGGVAEAEYPVSAILSIELWFRSNHTPGGYHEHRQESLSYTPA